MNITSTKARHRIISASFIYSRHVQQSHLGLLHAKFHVNTQYRPMITYEYVSNKKPSYRYRIADRTASRHLWRSRDVISHVTI